MSALAENKSKASSELEGKDSNDTKVKPAVPAGNITWKNKLMKEWSPDEVKMFVSQVTRKQNLSIVSVLQLRIFQIGVSENWKNYAEDLYKEKVDGVVLSVMVDIEAAVRCPNLI